MKKVLFTIIAVLSIAISAYAIDKCFTNNHSNSNEQLILNEVNRGIVFRTTQNLCCGSDQMMLYRSGTYELYQGGVEAYSGKYTIDTEYHVVVLDVEGTKLRCKFQYKKNGYDIAYLTFGNDTFYPCER